VDGGRGGGGPAARVIEIYKSIHAPKKYLQKGVTEYGADMMKDFILHKLYLLLNSFYLIFKELPFFLYLVAVFIAYSVGKHTGRAVQYQEMLPFMSGEAQERALNHLELLEHEAEMSNPPLW
jgi:hypothetical protein